MAPVASPCRLNVYFARDAPLGAVLRRGPSDWCRLSLWRTEQDEFEHGQWFRGRIYERRCDLSPDGSLFVYFARKSSQASPRDTWLAISRPPWLTALCLWFIGGTYFTGGFFVDAQTAWLGGISDEPDQGSVAPWLRISSDPVVYDRSLNWTNRTVHFNRLLRDGWVPSPALDDGSSWERVGAASRRTLVMTVLSETAYSEFGGPYLVYYQVRDDAGGTTLDLGRADWADWDQRGRLVVAREGRLWHWEGPDSLREIADFRQQVPEPAPSPTEEQSWPSRTTGGLVD